MPAPARTINLVPPSEFEMSFWGRFLKWAVTTGRYIIILTELVVILAFLSRFKLDRDLSNLNEEIEGKKRILEANLHQENEFLTVKQRLEAASTLVGEKQASGKSLDLLVEKIPLEVKANQISVTPRDVTLAANTLTEQAMGQLLVRMDKSQSWRSLDLREISADPIKGIKFLLKADIN